MLRKQKKKAQIADEEPEIEIITRIEVIYEDTKSITGIDPEYKWGEIYWMISNQSVPEVGFEDLPIYVNIERSTIMKVATWPDIFPCSEVIGWILPWADVTRMVLANIEVQGHVPYGTAYVSMAYKLSTPQSYLIEGWLKDLNLDVVETVKMMMILGKNFRTRPSGEYETSSLHTPYKLIALMLNRIFGRDNGRNFKIGWVPVIFLWPPKVQSLIRKI